MNDNDHNINEKVLKLRQSREQCFTVFFEMNFTDDSVEDILDNAVESRFIEADDFTMSMLNNFSANREEIDEIITKNIKGWTLKRLSKVTLSVLRFGITELKFLNTPVKVAINEAIELSKKYSTPKEAAFVNGVLGSVVKNEKLAKKND